MATETARTPASDLAPAVTRADVAAARERLGTLVRRTPAIRIEAGQLGESHPAAWLKLESLQATGAFKARGALNHLLAGNLPPAGVCAASGGNHGQAVAWAARLRGVPATVFVPTTCPPVKLRRMAEYRAVITVRGEIYEQSRASAELFAARTGALLVHPFDDALTVAGAGTAAAEFAEQVPDLDTILIAVGGGGLLAGSLAALEGTSTRVVAVEPMTARCLGAAQEAGEPVDVPVSGPAVDSLGVRRVGTLAFNAAAAHSVQHVDVTNEAISTRSCEHGKSCASDWKPAGPPRWQRCSAAPTGQRSVKWSACCAAAATLTSQHCSTPRLRPTPSITPGALRFR